MSHRISRKSDIEFIPIMDDEKKNPPQRERWEKEKKNEIKLQITEMNSLVRGSECRLIPFFHTFMSGCCFAAGEGFDHLKRSHEYEKKKFLVDTQRQSHK